MRMVRRRSSVCRLSDDEWGVPVHDDRHLFEFLVLEGAQAGLSWLTILKKRANYRQAFDNFDYERTARYTAHDVDRLLGAPGIVRNRRKIESAIKNARGVAPMSKDQKKRGFNFGSTICYAFMQATGMFNDHMIDCFRYRPIADLRRQDKREPFPAGD